MANKVGSEDWETGSPRGRPSHQCCLTSISTTYQHPTTSRKYSYADDLVLMLCQPTQKALEEGLHQDMGTLADYLCRWRNSSSWPPMGGCHTCPLLGKPRNITGISCTILQQKHASTQTLGWQLPGNRTESRPGPHASIITSGTQEMASKERIYHAGNGPCWITYLEVLAASNHPWSGPWQTVPHANAGSLSRLPTI